jgi:hypothetical protein
MIRLCPPHWRSSKHLVSDGIALTDDRVGADYEVSFMRLDAVGTKLGTEQQIRTSPDFSLSPAQLERSTPGAVHLSRGE